jgi:hypothetical protein
MKEGQLELLKIRKALAAVGYYAIRADMAAGVPIDTIHVRLFEKGRDEERIRRDEEILAQLPDDADREAWQEAHRRWKLEQKEQKMKQGQLSKLAEELASAGFEAASLFRTLRHMDLLHTRSIGG